MTRPNIRPAASFDAGAMAALLNEVVAEGSTAALAKPVSGDALRDEMATDGTIWLVAETDGDVLGFQWIGPHPDADTCEIATFVRQGRQGLGTGSALFDATCTAARAAGHAWIEAVIRADNGGGRAYYRSRGFEQVAIRPAERLADGRAVVGAVDKVVDRVVVRYRL